MLDLGYKVSMKTKVFIILIPILLLLVFLIQVPFGLHIFYEKQNKCSTVLERSCWLYILTKIQPIFDSCSGFIDGHAKVRQDIRIQGYTADEWEWFSKNPENPFMYNGEPLPSNYNLPKFAGSCINKYGEPISNEYCK